jgi:hypothetical protein
MNIRADKPKERGAQNGETFLVPLLNNPK